VPDARTTTYIAVEYQFGNGVSSAYAWRASVNQQKSAASMVEATQNDVLITITRDWNQLNLTNLQLKIVENQLQSAQDVVDSFLRQFSVGKRSWLDVLNAQRELIGVRNSLIDIKSANQQSRVRLLINTNNVNLDNLAQLGINN
jgi:adhesin transport system outer membrane protein